ncbi:unnamed protein product, partial [Gulo gulo]
MASAGNTEFGLSPPPLHVAFGESRLQAGAPGVQAPMGALQPAPQAPSPGPARARLSQRPHSRSHPAVLHPAAAPGLWGPRAPGRAQPPRGLFAAPPGRPGRLGLPAREPAHAPARVPVPPAAAARR